MVNFMRLLGYDYIYRHKINSNTFNFVHGFLFGLFLLYFWFGLEIFLCMFSFI